MAQCSQHRFEVRAESLRLAVGAFHAAIRLPFPVVNLGT
jgi:hypothetical protein